MKKLIEETIRKAVENGHHDVARHIHHRILAALQRSASLQESRKECSQDVDSCEIHQSCYNGVCTELLQVCSQDSDCQDGQACHSGLCANAKRSAAVGISLGTSSISASYINDNLARTISFGKEEQVRNYLALHHKYQSDIVSENSYFP